MQRYGVMPDCHVGFKAYGSTKRTEEATAQLEAGIDLLADHDTILFVGDMFDDTSIPNWVKREVIAIKERHAEQHWIIDGGNHDSTKTYSSTSALDVFGEVHNVTVVNQFAPQVIDGILLIPHHKSQTGFLSRLDEILAEGKTYAAIVLHCMVNSQWELSPNDMNIDQFRLEALGKLAKFVWLGHEHGAVQHGKNIFMAGSSLEFDFGQLGQKYVYSVDGDGMQMIPLTQPRKMFKVDVPWNGPVSLLDYTRSLDPEAIYKLDIGPVPLEEYSAAKNVMDLFETEHTGDVIYNIAKLGCKELRFTAIDASFNLQEELVNFIVENKITHSDKMQARLSDAFSQVSAIEEDV